MFSLGTCYGVHKRPGEMPRNGAMTEAPHHAGETALGIADHRREQMLRAALEVIAERGYADTRIADVAELTEAIRYSEDTWYADGQRRLAALPTAAARVEEIVAMSCLPKADPEPHDSWLLWLDFWALAARNPEVASLRQQADERWRDLIGSLVVSGQEAGEFRALDPGGFAILLSVLLDGMAIQIALEDPVVGPERA